MKKFSTSQQALQSIVNSASSEIEMLLSPFHFSKGSLCHDELPEIPVLTQLSMINVEDLSKKCCLLPCIKESCIKESCLTADEHNEIESTLKCYFGTEYCRTLLLYKYSSAVKFNGEMYGSINSLHSSSSLVFAKSNGITIADPVPGFVSKYVMLMVNINIIKYICV